jgi:cytochrome c
MRAIAIFGALFTATLMTGHALAQDAAAGEKVFNKCKVCHDAAQD